MAAPEDVNVDELRRRARRRLVGAIVLALAAAVVVPMLLESEPRPLGEDVAVRIPPVDDGKFVNRLNDPAAKPETRPAAPRSDSGSKGAPPPGDAAPAAKTPASPPAASAPDNAAAPRPKYDTALTGKDVPAAGAAATPASGTPA